MSHVISRDGTKIAFDRTGNGPALILVDGALCSRAFGPSAKLASAFAAGAANYSVYRYDRRGRGESGDTERYAIDREIEDLDALIAHAGGSAALLGLSSGGALALHAAAAGLPIDSVIAYEPPYVHTNGGGREADYEAELRGMIVRGNRGGAVTYFMRDMVGAPAFVPIMMRLMPWVWRKLVAVAHTLPYDAAVMTQFRVPQIRFASIRQPVLVLNGSKTAPRLKAAARALVATVPDARHGELAGQTHNVKPDALVTGSLAFLSSGRTLAERS
jgi:pimeloyl-ACP methyl ester carboxylesterase